MSEGRQNRATVRVRSNVSAIWLVPLIALGIGAWMLYAYMNRTGPEITLMMSDASGIEVGKTEIKTLNVKVGMVTDVKLDKDYNYILVKAQMNKDAARMLRDDTLFWIVKPRISKDGISGLDTILSGSYIQIQPGKAGQKRTEFTVLDVPPVAPPNAKGLRVLLNHKRAGQLDVGDPVVYQGFTAGRVEKINVDVEQKRAQYQLFIFQPFDALVRSNTNFWLNSGVDFTLNAEGFKVRIASIEALLGGGVSFGTVDHDGRYSEVVNKQYSEFPLYDNYQAVQEGQYDESVEFIVLFEDSLRGLTAGAPVEFRGVKIGSVTKAPLKRADLSNGFDVSRLPVLIKIEPERVFEKGESISDDRLTELIQIEFRKGLRAKLSTGNLITGALYIDVDYDKEAKTYVKKDFAGYPVFPDAPSELAEVQAKVMGILTRFSELPLNQTVTSMNRSLNELETTLATATETLATIKALVAKNDTQNLPADLSQSLEKLQATLDGFNANSTVYQNLDQALVEFENTMKAFQPVLRQLNDKPNSLVFGEDSEADPIPAKRNQQ